MNGEKNAQAGTDLISLIEQLQQPPEPPPVSMMPQTWGWAVLAALLLVAALWAAWRGWQRWHRNAYRRAALRELAAAGDDPKAIATILRRAALAAWPRENVASLTGEAWLAFLGRTGREAIPDAAARALTRGPYDRETATTPGLRQIAEAWVRQHKAGVAE
ncbi:DUF4381 domain-containing protein [Amaricoccus macauensis]|uniref:DUF4381 domain-containing protein n=1 Tax=Amaricoccus macauensis TaxID=57001 RepID=UPI003C799F36